MLQPGDDDFVTFMDLLPPPALRNEIDVLGGATDKNDFVGRWRIQEMTDFFARVFVGICRASCQFMRSAVDVGVFVLIEIAEAVDD